MIFITLLLTTLFKLFAAVQEGAHKDVEHAFGVLQSCFAILAHPARFFYTQDMHIIVRVCIILHNMIVEDERDMDLPMDYE